MKLDILPWGTEVIWASTEKYSGKIIILKENHETQFGYHKIRDKVICVLQGTVSLVLENRVKTLNEKDTYHINTNVMYQLKSLKGDATILEVGTGLANDFIEVNK